ncbi:unnamed protein product, partial [Prorocentrum cordatum]
GGAGAAGAAADETCWQLVSTKPDKAWANIAQGVLKLARRRRRWHCEGEALKIVK